MKMHTTIAAALAGLLILSAGTASAYEGAERYGPGRGAYPVQPHDGYSATPHIDQRQAQQHRRIRQGLHSGALTRHEARRLQQQQASIHRMERRARADGVVTPHERRRLRAAQDRASHAIRHQKHDGQRY